ncbi:MAG: NAD(P)-dependent oxidoreductase [Solirubrobacterales bacterium]
MSAPARRVGFIGLGIMGTRMAANLVRAGFELTVWNRTGEIADRWAADHGARAMGTPAEVAATSDVVITMVVDGAQVEALLLGETGAAEGAHDDSLFVDMSTIGPVAARRIGETLATRGVGFIDAPVTGSSPKAEDGTLTIMVGGDAEDLERVRPLLETMGDLIVHAGPIGHGQAIKVINNAVAAINTAVVGEALLAGRAMGVDLDALVRVMSAGSGGSAMLDLKSGPMRSRDYVALFKLEHMLKDVRLCLEEAERAGIELESARWVERALAAAAEQGHGDKDFVALVEALETRSGTRLY